MVSLQQDYLDIVSNEIISELTQKYTNMTLTELLKDIEINISDLGKEEQDEFIKNFLVALRGENTPR